MFQKSNDQKSDSDRLFPASRTINRSNYNNTNLFANNNSRPTNNPQSQNCQDSNSQRDELRSQQLKSATARSNSNNLQRNFHSLSQHSHPLHNKDSQSANSNTNPNHQRIGTHLTRTSTNPHLHQDFAPSNRRQQTANVPPILSSPSSQPTFTTKTFSDNSSPLMGSVQRQTSRNQNSSITADYSSTRNNEEIPASIRTARQDDQLDRDCHEVVTMIKEEYENDVDGFLQDSGEIETLGSFERNLPVELSFLIRQQAYCMARMNYLDRQIRELKEVRNVGGQPQLSTTLRSSNIGSHNPITSTPQQTTKNGNFIPSDDSGGEYSRATISDDDELSSLLDQIAKSVRPERSINQSNHLSSSSSNNIGQQRSYSIINNQPQPYAIINPNQLHHQAMPIFVMSPPMAVAHPSSISSNVLPGVHFQPEPRYNQYYEDFYGQTNSAAPSNMHRHHDMRYSRQFDSSISAIEQLVSQKEKRQIKSQLKSADNWLKMRSSVGSNLGATDKFCQATSKGCKNDLGPSRDLGLSSNIERNMTSFASANIERDNSNSEIEGNRSR